MRVSESVAGSYYADEKSNGNYSNLGKRLGSNVSYEHIRVRHSDTDRTSLLVETLIETGETKQLRGESIRGREGGASGGKEKAYDRPKPDVNLFIDPVRVLHYPAVAPL